MLTILWIADGIMGGWYHREANGLCLWYSSVCFNLKKTIVGAYKAKMI